MGDHAQYDRQYRNLSSTELAKIAGSHPAWGSPTVMEPFGETPQELIRITHYKKWNDATVYPIDANGRQKREAWTFFDATQSDGESTLLRFP